VGATAVSRTGLMGCARRLGGALLLLVGSAHVAQAHAIHTTLTVLTPTADGITLLVRAFADDFSASVARYAGKPAPADSSAPELDVMRYMRAQLTVQNAAGEPVVLQPCGMRRADGLYWVCFRAVLPSRGRGALLRNRMLTELHVDQVNIVQSNNNGARATMLFTKASAPSVLR
jgi:hypothetical protein